MFGKWPYSELAEVGVQVYDCEHKTPLDAGEGYPYVAIPNLVDGRLKLDSVRRITSEDLESWTRRTKPEGGDVILTRRGRVGDSAVIPQNLECAIGQNLVILRSDSRMVDQGYLRWATRGKFWHEEVSRLINVGAVFNSLNVRDISRMRIFVPPVTVQRAISSVISAFDDKIALNDRYADTLLKLAHAHYLSAGAVDGGWRDRVLGDVAVVDMGQSPPGDSCNRIGEGTPLLNGPTEFGQYSPMVAQWTTEPSRFCRTGDLLLCVRGSTTGRLNWADRQYAVGRGLAAIRARRYPAETNLVFFSLLAKMSELLAMANGSVFPNLTRATIESLPIAWPEGDYEHPICGLIGSFTNAISARATENESLTLLRDTLLPKLMSGEIRVRDAEKVVEGAV